MKTKYHTNESETSKDIALVLQMIWLNGLIYSPPVCLEELLTPQTAFLCQLPQVRERLIRRRERLLSLIKRRPEAEEILLNHGTDNLEVA